MVERPAQSSPVTTYITIWLAIGVLMNVVLAPGTWPGEFNSSPAAPRREMPELPLVSLTRMFSVE